MFSRFRDSSTWKAISDLSVVAWIASTVGGAVTVMATWLHHEPLYLVMFYASAVFCLLSVSSYHLSRLWRHSHPHVNQKPNLKCVCEYKGQEAVVTVTNVGAIGDVWASLNIDGAVHGRTRDIFARWAHTDSVRARVAKGQTCRLVLAILRIGDIRMPLVTWQIPFSTEGNGAGISEAVSSSLLIGNDGQAADIHIYITLLSEPDSECGAMNFHAVLHSKRAEFLCD